MPITPALLTYLVAELETLQFGDGRLFVLGFWQFCHGASVAVFDRITKFVALRTISTKSSTIRCMEFRPPPLRASMSGFSWGRCTLKMGIIALALAASMFSAPAFAASAAVSASGAATIGGSTGTGSSAAIASDTGFAAAGSTPGGSAAFSTNTAFGADVTHGAALAGFASGGFSAAGSELPF